MSLIQASTLSYQPSANQWKLHVSASTIKKMRNSKIPIQMGAKNREKRITLTSVSPSYGSIATKVRLVRDRDGFTVGPLIGILTVRRGTGFKGNKRNFIDIIRTAKKLGALVYVFTVEDIQWSTQTTAAFLYDEQRATWKSTAQLPLPDVVYNRIPYRTDEQRPAVQSAINQLRSLSSLHLFNSHFFNKWELYKKLGSDPRVARYVPDTIQFHFAQHVVTMIKKHPLLYLKPIDGKAGNGIMTLETHANHFVLKQRVKSKLIVRKFANQRQLWHVLKDFIPRNYVLQQGIQLATFENRAFDVRILLQKGKIGTFKISGIGIRVAGKDSITTHVPRGGSIASPDVVLKSIHAEEYVELLKRIHTTALKLATTLESYYPDLGEMSMDIGLDHKGNLWFFEANAKPMKFDEPHIRKTSLERIVEYSQHLSKFKNKEEHVYASQTNHS